MEIEEEEQERLDRLFMTQALRQAEEARRRGEVPIGAVIAVGADMIAKAHNLTETLHDPTAHAEMQALTMATEHLGGKYLADCTLYVTVEPCVMCAGAIGWCQVGRVVYGAPDVKRGYKSFAPKAMHPKTEVRDGVMCDECAAIIKDFFKKKR